MLLNLLATTLQPGSQEPSVLQTIIANLTQTISNLIGIPAEVLAGFGTLFFVILIVFVIQSILSFFVPFMVLSIKNSQKKQIKLQKRLIELEEELIEIQKNK